MTSSLKWRWLNCALLLIVIAFNAVNFSGGSDLSIIEPAGRGKVLLDVTGPLPQRDEQNLFEWDKLLHFGNGHAYFASSLPLSPPHLKEMATLFADIAKDTKFYLSFRQIDDTHFEIAPQPEEEGEEDPAGGNLLSLSPIAGIIIDLTSNETCSSEAAPSPMIQLLPTYLPKVNKSMLAPTSLLLGIAFNGETLLHHNCNNNNNNNHAPPQNLSELVDFVVLSVSFKTQVGLPESYSLFSGYMDDIFAKNAKFIGQKLGPISMSSSTMFYVELKYFCQDESQHCATVNSEYTRLLKDYSKQWAEERGHNVILRVPDATPLTRTDRVFTSISSDSSRPSSLIIPTLHLEGTPEVVRNSLLFSLNVISSTFATLHVDYEMWKEIDLNLKAELESGNKHQFLQLQNPLYVIVEVNRIDNLHHLRNIFQHITSLQELCHQHGISLRAIDLPMNFGSSRPLIHLNRQEELEAIGILESATIGCLLPIDIEAWTLSTILRRTKSACGFIYGVATFITWYVTFNFKLEANNKEPFGWYVSHIQRNLNKVLEAREELLADKPLAIVTLKVHTPSPYSLPTEDGSNSHLRNFYCHRDVQLMNQYYEALSHWGRINNFQVHLKNAFESDTQFGWWSHLGPAPAAPAFEPSKWGGGSRRRMPEYVMRNYDGWITQWKVDPCVEWSKEVGTNPTEFGEEIGTTINMQMREASLSLKSAELEAMLVFSFHKFGAVEVLLGSGESQAENLNILKEVLSPNFFQVLEENKVSTGEFVVELSAEGMDPLQFSQIVSEVAAAWTKSGASSAGSNFSLGIQLADLHDKINIHALVNLNKENKFLLGMQMSMAECWAMLHYMEENSSPSSSSPDFPHVNFLLCEVEPVPAANNDNLSFASGMDSLLYLERAFSEIPGPELELRFRLNSYPCCGGGGSSEVENFLRWLNDASQFASGNDLKVFLVQGVAPPMSRSTSWWAIEDYTELSNVSVYFEKEAEFHKSPTWRPILGPRQPSTDELEGNSEIDVGNRINSPAQPTQSQSSTPLAHEPSPIVAEHSMTSTWIASGSGGLGGLVMILLFGVIFLRVRKRNSRLLSEVEVEEFLHGISNPEQPPEEDMPIYLRWRLEPEFYLAKGDFDFSGNVVLGSGKSGKSVKALYAGGQQVSVKTPKSSVTTEQFKSLLAEVKAMACIENHENIIQFVGCYVEELNKGVIWVATEIAESGSLLLFLKQVKARSADRLEMTEVQELTRFAYGIASGMEFLWDRDIVHGDLCAKNVLLNSERNCKLINFGGFRGRCGGLKPGDKGSGPRSTPPLRWQWMAFESLAGGEFTSMSDSWSFGITLWEIFSLGESPYPEVRWSPSFPQEIKNGLRPSKPFFASERMFHKMSACWTSTPMRRPTFYCIRNFLNLTLNS